MIAPLLYSQEFCLIFLIQYCRLWKFLLKNETQFTAAVSSVRKDKISHSSRDIDRDKDDASRTFKNCKSQGNRGSASLMVMEPFELDFLVIELSLIFW